MLRTIDIVLTLVGLAIALPLLLLAMLAIRLDSPGPALFGQTRVGRGRVPFTCWKLRTMRAGTPQAASHHIGADAITSVGGFLRRYKIDELPQLWNVLKGDMSLVGPRPCIPCHREVIEHRERAGVYAMRPGITGPAQIARIDMSTPERLVAADRLWLQAGVRAYVAILLLTVLGHGSGDAATGYAFLSS